MTEARPARWSSHLPDGSLNRPPTLCSPLSKPVISYKIPGRGQDEVSEIEGLARRVAFDSETWRGIISPMTGRPHKGARRVIMTRPAQPVADVVLREAAAAGMTISDYVAGILARAVGLPQYVPASPAQDQQELPLKTA